MKPSRILAISGLILFVVVAVWADVSTDWDKSANFANYKTYAWSKGTPAQNPLMDQRIVDGVDKQLAAKGFQKVDENGSPDLVVLYHAAVGKQQQLNTMDTGGWGWRWGGGTSTTTVETIPVGQLTVDIGDAKTKKLLWMGSASGTLSSNPQGNEKKINDAIEKMFKKFPPPPKK